MSVLIWLFPFASLAMARLVLAVLPTPFMPLLILVPVGLVSFLFLVFPQSLLLVLVFTMGIALPLVFLPTVALYLAAALLPAALVRLAGCRQPLALGVAAIGVFALALGLPWYADASARRAASQLAVDDRAEGGRSRPTTIGFIGRAEFYRGHDYDPHGINEGARCDAICQKLLLNREVEWVRIVAYNKHGPGQESVGASHLYLLENRILCPPLVPVPANEIPETQDARARGICLVADDTNPKRFAPAEARVELRVVSNARPRTGSGPESAVVGLRHVEVTLKRGDSERRRLGVGTDFVLRPLRAPFSITFEGGFDSTFRPALSRTWKTFRPVDVADLLRTTLGYRI
jgi:hypothetical protein